ncbi:MAG: ATP-binding domain-containing protein [Nocardioidaceae bacterium]
MRFLPWAAGEAIATADEAVDAALDAGWRPQDVALLTTGSRHPEQTERQAEGQDDYWASFWDEDQVFYGHVLGFKGLERRVIVLAVNESEPRDRAKERLYVGLSRARDELIVCGDLDYIARAGGEELAQRLEWSTGVPASRHGHLRGSGDESS